MYFSEIFYSAFLIASFKLPTSFYIACSRVELLDVAYDFSLRIGLITFSTRWAVERRFLRVDISGEGVRNVSKDVPVSVGNVPSGIERGC